MVNSARFTAISWSAFIRHSSFVIRRKGLKWSPLALAGEVAECLVEERAEVPAHYIFVGRLA